MWTCDNAGNITSREEYEFFEDWDIESAVPIETYTYTYGDSSWGDLLTAYNGVARTYDEIGNLLTYGTWTYTWQNGRELAAMTDGTTTWSYTYDANGMRTRRTNGTKTYNYVYNGSQLTQMTVGNDTLYFTYGLLGPTTVTWNGETYYYVVNGQGDVTGIYDSAGALVVVYNWDNAWGYNTIPEGPLADTLGVLNPLRYRGYVYDTETGYYYLQSRYYDPEIGRFINADGLITTGQGLIGHNMFAYCGNNPVSRYDSTGTYYASILDRITTDGYGGRGAVPKMITNQSADGVGNKPLGITTVSHGGCGPVATYNALITLGDAKNFDAVLNYYNALVPDRTVAFGLLGTLPYQVANYFIDNGYRVVVSTTRSGIESLSQTADACILWYAYPQKHLGIDLFNAHFEHYHQYGKRYKTYNTNTPSGMWTFENPYDYGTQGDRYCPIGIFIYK